MVAWLILLAAASAPSVGFQGYLIGQTVDEAKGVALPASKYSERVLRCTGDLDAPNYLTITEDEAAAGVVRCWPTEVIGGGRVRSDLPVSNDVTATTELLFHGGRLQQIETVYDHADAPVIADALRLRFGSPAGGTAGTAQTPLGATFPQTKTTWRVGNSTITMLDPALTIERMMVTYESADWGAIQSQIRVGAAAKARI